MNAGTLALTGSLQTDTLRVSLGATFAMNGATATFTGTVTNGGTFEAVSSKATFGASFTNNGALITDPTSLAFADLSVGTSGFIQAVSGDLYSVSGNFINQSQDRKDWNTRSATLEFVTGGTTTHDLSLAAADGGVTLSKLIDNFAWGVVRIDAGNQLSLENAGHALYTGELLGARVSGNVVTNITGNGLNIYYEASDPGNAYLGGLDYALENGGALIAANGVSAVPEPRSEWLYLVGIVGLGAAVRRHASAGRARSDS